MNVDILAEYEEVFSREKFKFNLEKQNKFIDDIKKVGTLIVVAESDIPMTDESDRKFYDAAKASNSILITGNITDFPNEDFIKTPAEFIREMERERERQQNRMRERDRDRGTGINLDIDM